MTAVAAPPLAMSLDEVRRTIPWCTFRLATAVTGPWVRCSEALADPSFFPNWQRDLGAKMAQGRAEVPPVTPAGYIMGWYTGIFGYLGGTLFHLARRVPSLAPESLALRMDPQRCRPVEVAMLDHSFSCLPGDPAAGSAEATVLPGLAPLAQRLRQEAAAHGTRFVQSYRRSSRFGIHTLWGAVTDALDRGLWHAAHVHGRDAAGAADARLVLPGQAAPFTSASTIRTVFGRDGRPHWTRTRQSCCFHYKLPDVGAACVTCPRLSEEQRCRLLG